MDILRLTQLFCQSFVVPETTESQTIAAFGEDNIRTLTVGEDLAGALVLIPMQQHYGGCWVSCAGIGSVAVAPHHRGQGVAQTLLRRSLQELQAQNIALSVLYPATPPLYRRLGYETAGFRVLWSLPLAQVPRQSSPLEVIALTPTLEQLKPLYDRWVTIGLANGLHQGLIDRHPGIWHLLLKASSYGYGFRSSTDPQGDLQGYVLYQQDRTAAGTILKVMDWVCLTPAAQQSSWAFWAQHQAQLDTLCWVGSMIEPHTLRYPAKIHDRRPWMVRILNLALALEQRGYPSHLDVDLHLDISDPLFPENHDRFCLRVCQGRGTVTRGGQGHLKTTIAHFVPLFTGLLTPQQLQHQGLLSGDDRSLGVAQYLFGGASPWLVDFF